MLAAASAAAGLQHFPAGTLYVVATPIGNLADLTLRAIHVLVLVDAVACEDTRVGGALLHQLGIAKPLLALHRHNEHSAAAGVLARLAKGERVACISDAGTPAIADPGAALVAAAVAAGHRVLPIPGASSVLAALSVAGDMAADGFGFVGFLPAKGAARSRRLAAVLSAHGTQLLFEAPHRIVALGAELAALAAARRLTLCRELTKQFESVVTMFAAELPAWLAADPNRERGEFVIVLHAVAGEVGPAVDADRVLAILLGELPVSRAAAIAAEITGTSRKALYERALALRGTA